MLLEVKCTFFFFLFLRQVYVLQIPRKKMTSTPHTLWLPAPALLCWPEDSHLPAALRHLSFVHPDTLCLITNHEQKLLTSSSEILWLYVTLNSRSGIKATRSTYSSVCNPCSSSCEKELFKREMRLGWAIRDFFFLLTNKLLQRESL